MTTYVTDFNYTLIYQKYVNISYSSIVAILQPFSIYCKLNYENRSICMYMEGTNILFDNIIYITSLTSTLTKWSLIYNISIAWPTLHHQ